MRKSILVITPGPPMYGGGRIEFSWWQVSGVEVVDYTHDSMDSIVKQRLLSALESGASGVILNLENVRWLGSTGVGYLLGWRRAVLDHGKNLVLAAVNDRVQLIFEVTKLASLLDCHASVSEAAEYLDSMGHK